MTMQQKYDKTPVPCRTCKACLVTVDHTTSECARCGKLPDKKAKHDIEREKGACANCSEKAHYPDCDGNHPCPYVVR